MSAIRTLRLALERRQSQRRDGNHRGLIGDSRPQFAALAEYNLMKTEKMKKMKGSSLVLRRREFEKYLLQVFVIRSILRGEDKLRQVHRKRNLF